MIDKADEFDLRAAGADKPLAEIEKMVLDENTSSVTLMACGRALMDLAYLAESAARVRAARERRRA